MRRCRSYFSREHPGLSIAAQCPMASIGRSPFDTPVPPRPRRRAVRLTATMKVAPDRAGREPLAVGQPEHRLLAPEVPGHDRQRKRHRAPARRTEPSLDERPDRFIVDATHHVPRLNTSGFPRRRDRATGRRTSAIAFQATATGASPVLRPATLQVSTGYSVGVGPEAPAPTCSPLQRQEPETCRNDRRRRHMERNRMMGIMLFQRHPACHPRRQRSTVLTDHSRSAECYQHIADQLHATLNA